MRRVGVLLLGCAVVMVPWSVYVFRSLPRRAEAAHFDLAWGGFDVLLTLSLFATAYQALARTRWLSTTAAATATLLLVDAWFDVVTAPPGGPRHEAVLSAALVELPLMAGCLWLTVNAQRWQESSLAERLRRPRRRGSRTSPPA